MSFHCGTCFEFLPDEMILEICRYLHCSHVLYSFFDLNSRLNQTITFYRQHVWFRRASYQQLIYIYRNVLPRLSSSILSLSIHPLHQASFPFEFQQNLSKIFSKLETLTLISWTSKDLLAWIPQAFQGPLNLNKLIVEELSCSSLIDNFAFLEQIFLLNNPMLTTIHFDYDCDPFDLSNYSNREIRCDFLLDLKIQLDTLKDFSTLIDFIPNIRRLNVTLKKSSLKKVPFQTKLLSLTEFSIRAFHWYSNFDDLSPIFSICPSVIEFYLNVSSRDIRMINGQMICSVLPATLKTLHYAVCYYASDECPSIDETFFRETWSSIPIVFSVSQTDRRIYLHTLPYRSTRLTIRSSLAKNMTDLTKRHVYQKVEQIKIYALDNINEIFSLLKQCSRVKDLVLLTASENNQRENRREVETNKRPIQLPSLPRLDALTIEGIPGDLSRLKELFLAARNLSVLVIDLECLLKILDNEEESLMLFVYLHRQILYLCIRIPDAAGSRNRITFGAEQLHFITRIFGRVRNLTIDYESSDCLIEPSLIHTVVRSFPNLVIFHIYGKVPDEIPRQNLRQWFIENNSERIKDTDLFRIECSNEWFKLWL